MVCVFCLLVCAPTDIALGLLVCDERPSLHTCSCRQVCMCNPHLKTLFNSLFVMHSMLTRCISCIECAQYSFLSLRPPFVIDFAILSKQMLYSVYCQLSHSLAVVWAVTHPVAIALCENSFDSIKCILGSPAFKCAINTQMSRHSHSTTDIHTVHIKWALHKKIDHITQKCVILLSKEYQLCSVVRVNAFSISVYL